MIIIYLFKGYLNVNKMYYKMTKFLIQLNNTPIGKGGKYNE